jgi:hypothetical protein
MEGDIEKTLKFLAEHNIKTPEQLKEYYDKLLVNQSTDKKENPMLDSEGGVTITPEPGFVVKLTVVC